MGYPELRATPNDHGSGAVPDHNSRGEAGFGSAAGIALLVAVNLDGAALRDRSHVAAVPSHRGGTGVGRLANRVTCSRLAPIPTTDWPVNTAHTVAGPIGLDENPIFNSS